MRLDDLWSLKVFIVYSSLLLFSYFIITSIYIDMCICEYTCYGLHQKTSLVSIRPHSSAHTGDSSTQCPTLPSRSCIRSFTWWGLGTSSWSSACSLDRPTPQRHRICSCQPLETGHSTGPWCSDGAGWLRDDDEYTWDQLLRSLINCILHCVWKKIHNLLVCTVFFGLWTDFDIWLNYTE